MSVSPGFLECKPELSLAAMGLRIFRLVIWLVEVIWVAELNPHKVKNLLWRGQKDSSFEAFRFLLGPL